MRGAAITVEQGAIEIMMVANVEDTDLLDNASRRAVASLPITLSPLPRAIKTLEEAASACEIFTGDYDEGRRHLSRCLFHSKRLMLE